MKKYLYLVASAIGFMLAVVACSSGGGSSSTAATGCTANAAGCVYGGPQYGWLSQGSCPAGYVQMPTGYAGYNNGYNGYNGYGYSGYPTSGYATTPYANGYNGQNCVLATQISGGYSGGYNNGYYNGGGYYQGGCPAGQALVNGQCALLNNGMISTPYYNYPPYGGGYMYGYTGGGCKTFWGGLGWYCAGY